MGQCACLEALFLREPYQLRASVQERTDRSFRRDPPADADVQTVPLRAIHVKPKSRARKYLGDFDILTPTHVRVLLIYSKLQYFSSPRLKHLVSQADPRRLLRNVGLALEVEHRADRLLELTAVVALAGMFLALVTSRPAIEIGQARDETTPPASARSNGRIVADQA